MNPADELPVNDNNDAPARPISNSTRIRPIDILCSTEPQYAVHRGNQDYAVTVSAYMLQHPHRDLERLQERVITSREIVEICRARDARFLAKTRRGTWKDVGDELAVRWVSLHLRRMAENMAEAQDALA